MTLRPNNSLGFQPKSCWMESLADWMTPPEFKVMTGSRIGRAGAESGRGDREEERGREADLEEAARARMSESRVRPSRAVCKRGFGA